uniref:CCHC-type domain-containing protein n=1 Tax=Tanacetum cinerariifolium TaxID=118510 RepID=A0A6L2JRP2_TANCI|nr:hypothetical protein [Tanacetum cinerariifolium]
MPVNSNTILGTRLTLFSFIPFDFEENVDIKTRNDFCRVTKAIKAIVVYEAIRMAHDSINQDIEADATTVKVEVDRDVVTEVDAGIDMEVDVKIDVEDEVESSDRGTMEVGVDMAARIDIPDGMLIPDVVERLEIKDIEMGQRELVMRSLIVDEKRASLLDQVASLQRSNARLQDTMMMARARTDDVVDEIGIPNDILMPNVVECLKQVKKAIKVAVDRDVKARIDVGIGMEVYVGVDVEDEVESSDRGTMEVGVDVVDEIGIPNDILMPNVVECLKQVKKGDVVGVVSGGTVMDVVRIGIVGIDDGNVIAAEPTRLQDAIRIANNLMDQKLKGPCTVRCGKCKKVGHLTRDCKAAGSTTSNQRGQVVNQRVLTSFECGRQEHYKSDCPKLKDQGRGNKTRNKNGVGEARGKAYVLSGGDTNPDSNVITNVSYAIELADERISVTNTILKGSNHHAVIVCDEKIGRIPYGDEVLIVQEVGAAVVASLVRVLELDTHSSSEDDPSEISPPPVFVAPMMEEQIASRPSSPTTSTPKIPTAPILPASSAIVAPSSEFPLAPVVAPLGIHR